LLLVRATYIWVLFFAHIPFVVREPCIQRNDSGEVATLPMHFFPNIAHSLTAEWLSEPEIIATRSPERGLRVCPKRPCWLPNKNTSVQKKLSVIRLQSFTASNCTNPQKQTISVHHCKYSHAFCFGLGQFGDGGRRSFIRKSVFLHYFNG